MLILLGSYSSLSFSSVYAAGIQPTDVLQNGYALFSCFANSSSAPALAVIDLNPAGGLYDDPANRTTTVDVSSSFAKTAMWNLSEFNGGQIMGTAFNRHDGTIYVSTSRMYQGTSSSTPGSADIWRIAPNGGTPVLFATLPGNQGTGWLELDDEHDQIYVSNMDDGLIYIIDTTLGPGQTMASTGGYATFAPHAADNLNEDTNGDNILDGMPPLGERIWGVGYNRAEERLYYVVWARDYIGTGNNTIRSVAVNSDGTIASATDKLEATMTDLTLIWTDGNPLTTQMPPSDIDFSQDGQIMLLAEQSFDSTVVPGGSPAGIAHLSRLIELRGGSGNWVAEPGDKHRIGRIPGLTEYNSRGGTSFMPHNIDSTGLLEGVEEYIVTTGDALAVEGGIFVYGLQYHPITGGHTTDSLKIDLNGDVNEVGSKYLYGDIDVRMERKDFGDLPDSYDTVDASNGATHVIDDITYLGTGVDAEGDGQPSPNADGDDGNQDGTHDSDLPDDEDGIVFLDPLMPGETARIQVVAGGDGYLNAFIDFDNNGTLDNVTINAASATGSAGLLSDLQLTAGTHLITIDVPGTTVGDVGDVVYSRFRFTANAGEATTSTGLAATGEVEDYVLMSLGNRVWLDNGAGTGIGDDGAMNGSETGISGVVVQLYDATGTTQIAETTTSADGTYLFTGLVADTYVVHIPASNFGAGQPLEETSSSTDSATTGNVDPDSDTHDESNDENGIDAAAPATNGISSQPITLAYGGEPTSDGNSNNSNLTVDFGFVAYDWGDLPDGNASGSPTYNTLDGSGGPSHIIQPGLFMGTLVDSEEDGQPSATALGDDGVGTPDDEEGVTFPPFYPSESAVVNVIVTNAGTTAATLYGFIDFNGDGDFGDAGESVNVAVPAGSNGAVTTLTFNVPATADTTQQLGARFRLSTDVAAASADGGADDGEVEDYLISVSGLEYGDLPDIYGTVKNGAVTTPAVHVINDTVKLGATIDAETDGLASNDADGDDTGGSPDDEDGITFLDPLMPGETARIQVVAGSDGYLNAFIDFDNNGTLDNVTINATSATGSAGPLSDLQLTAGTHLITIDVPGTTVGDVGDVIYSRFRFTANAGEATTATGFAATGEVEDYVLMSLGNRVWLDNGAGTGTGDDGAMNGSETGISGVVVQLYDATGTTQIAETTTSADGTYLFTGLVADTYVVHIPASNFGAGQPLEEMSSSADSATTGNVDPDSDTHDESNDENGIDAAAPATDGISSHPITLAYGGEPTSDGNSNNSNLTVDFGFVAYDWGDLPDGNASGSPTYNTLDSSGGPSHIIQPGLFMGMLVDSEEDGQPSATALGDDAVGTPDDEDGVTFPPFYLSENAAVNVIVTNAGTTAATLYGFIDFNGDGDFGDAGESVNVAVPAGSNGAVTTLTFNVPATADTTQQLGARFRLSTDVAAASADGVADGGEVEDYLISVFGLEYGDLPDIYGTVKNGVVTTPAVHVINDTVKLGTTIDSETDGLASDDANGDDTDGSPDDEDGIIFLDPLMPGETARIQVVAGSDGYLNAFIDFDNDGTLDNVTINAASATGSAGLLSDLQLTAGVHLITIDVPGTTVGDVGEVVYSRFRFTANAGEATTATGLAATGEVEDYVLMSLGNRVWLDNGAGTGTGDDGAMNGSETGISGVVVQLYDATGTTQIAETTTSADGTYLFTGLVADTYVVHIPASNFGAGQPLEEMSSSTDSATTGNVDPDSDTHDESNDENGIDAAAPATNGISSQPITLAYGGEPTSDGNSDNSNLTVDFSFVAYDWGDLPDGNASGSPTYNTLDGSGGPSHIIQPGLFMGTLVDPEEDGQPSATALGDDAVGTPDDEDGVTFPPFYPSKSAAVDVVVTNAGTTAATLYGFIDFNGDGDFVDAGESVNVAVPAGSNGVVTTLTFNVPATADITQQLGARFRLSTDVAAASADGGADDGEVEDYLISASGLEYGDLPDIYGTVKNGVVITPAVHVIDDIVKLGTTIDSETDGLASDDANGDDTDGSPDDEDGITFLDPLMPGETARIQVVAGSDGYLNAFIDFDNNGTLDSVNINAASATGSAGLLSDLQLTAGTHLITIDVPGTTVGDVGEVIYSRFRFTANAGEATTPTGFAATGEVEDYVLMSLGNRVWLDNGAGTGTGDDGAMNGSETGISGVVVQLYDATGTTQIAETTTSADGTYLFTGLVADTYVVRLPAGNFGAGQPLEEMSSSTDSATTGNVDPDSDTHDESNDENGVDDAAPATNGISSQPITLAYGGEPTSDGNSDNSNLTVDFGFVAYDWGDLPDGNASGSPTYNTLDGSGGPSHIIQPGLFMGMLVDSEEDGQPSATALGDDAVGTPDDEDGVTFPPFYPSESAAVNVIVTNAGTTAATLYGFIDFNGDGDFGDAGESVNVAVPAGSNGAVTTLTFNVPATADTTQQLGARFRLSTDVAAASADGVADGGEVEDYLISISRLEYGDLPDVYGTVKNGVVTTPAVHVIDDTVKLGATIDSETDGLASDDANGDDTDGSPDDEDGITFLDPLMPGETARIQVVAGSDGYLNAFIDFDNDGTLDNVTINAASATGSVGPLSDLQLTAGTHLITIDVPGTTVGDVGEVIYSRFRFTANAGEATTATGFAATGEVEDYVLMSLGNRVWLDEGAGNEDNGLFDGNELPAANVLMELYGLNNTRIATTMTNADGYYLFSGLNEGTYTVTVAPVNFQSGGPLEDYLSTTGADGSETVDSTSANSDNGIDDLEPEVNGISSNAITLALGSEPSGEEHLGGTDSSNNSNLTVDFGFYEFIIVFELSKVLNTPSPVRIGGTISFTIRITNTGETVIRELPLVDRYNNAYLDYVSASPMPDNPTSGELIWNDLTVSGATGFGADLNPGETFEIVVEFISQLDTTELPNEHTTNVAMVLEMSDSADVQILAPTSVLLATREVSREGQGVVLRWETADETDIVGFYLYRRQGEDGTLLQLTQSLMIAENSGRSLGTAYRYIDRTAQPNIDYAYFVGIVNTQGLEAQSLLGEVMTSRTFNGWSIYLPIMTK